MFYFKIEAILVATEDKHVFPLRLRFIDVPAGLRHPRGRTCFYRVGHFHDSDGFRTVSDAKGLKTSIVLHILLRDKEMCWVVLAHLLNECLIISERRHTAIKKSRNEFDETRHKCR